MDPNDILSLGDVDPEQFAVHNYDMDVKYKSMSVASSSSFIALEHSFGAAHSRPLGLSKGSKGPHAKLWSSQGVQSVKSDTDEIVVRDAPYLLMKTHFTSTAFSLNAILDVIEQVLNESLENSFEFISSECTWKALNRQGTSNCRFDISVYKGTSESSYIIEAHKLSSGDGLMFKSIYEDIKTNLSLNTVRTNLSEQSFTSMSTPVPSSEIPLSESEIDSTIHAVVRMSKEGNLEAVEEASRLLFDMSMHDTLLQHMCSAEVFECFQSLLAVDDRIFDGIRHNAVLAIANLSDSQVGQAMVLDTGIISMFLKLACNGSYKTIDMRRESARIVANVASKLAPKVSASVNATELFDWVNTVDDLDDDRLRMHAERAKFSLQTVV